MREFSVWNLEFPSYLKELNIAGYKFCRNNDYEQAFSQMQHLVEVYGGEYPIKPNTGTHQRTAVVEIPDHEEKAILPWMDPRLTKLQDVLFFLSLFTGRNVFCLAAEEEGFPLIQDSRQHAWGGQFRLSRGFDLRWRHKKSGALKVDHEMEGVPVFDYEPLDFGLQQTIEAMLELVSSPAWRSDYDTGYFLFTFRQAIRQHDIEPAFILSWTIWEHLFTLHNQKWLDENTIRNLSGENKIGFILHRYLLKPYLNLEGIDDQARRALNRLARARNRLIHFGPKPEAVDYKEMGMFVRLTEQVVALTLGLEPSNALNSFDHLQRFLHGENGSNSV